MQFHALVTFFGLTVTLVAAVPAPPVNLAEIRATRDIATNATVNLDLDAVACNKLKCIDLFAAAGCMAAAAITDQPASVLSCVAGNTDKICDCAECFPAAGSLLEKKGVC